MNGEEKKKTESKLLVSLVLLLVGAVCVQTYFIMRLHRQLDSALNPTPSINVATPQSSPASPSQSPSGFSIAPLNPNSDFFANPLAELKRMQEQMNRLFGDSLLRLGQNPIRSSGKSGMVAVPRLDLSDQGDHFVIRMDLPGAEKANINVEVKGRTLTVSAKRDEVQETKDKSGRVIRRERQSGNFLRTMTLPEDVKADAVEAKYENGVLVITIPKATKQKHESHRIEIQ